MRSVGYIKRSKQNHLSRPQKTHHAFCKGSQAQKGVCNVFNTFIVCCKISIFSVTTINIYKTESTVLQR